MAAMLASSMAMTAMRSEGERVDALRIVLVHFQLRRHALLLDEHNEADALRLGLRRGPVEQFDFEHALKSIIAA